MLQRASSPGKWAGAEWKVRRRCYLGGGGGKSTPGGRNRLNALSTNLPCLALIWSEGQLMVGELIVDWRWTQRWNEAAEGSTPPASFTCLQTAISLGF